MRSQNLPRAIGAALPVLLLAALTACEPLEGRRGYTKKPLEKPGLIIEREPTTLMDELGDPVLIPQYVEPTQPNPGAGAPTATAAPAPAADPAPSPDTAAQ